MDPRWGDPTWVGKSRYSALEADGVIIHTPALGCLRRHRDSVSKFEEVVVFKKHFRKGQKYKMWLEQPGSQALLTAGTLLQLLSELNSGDHEADANNLQLQEAWHEAVDAAGLSLEESGRLAVEHTSFDLNLIFLYCTKTMDQDETPASRAAKIEAMRADLVGYPDLLARFNEIHPRPAPGPTTLEEALASTAASSAAAATDIQPVGSWYGLRYKFRLTCVQEYRLERFMDRLL